MFNTNDRERPVLCLVSGSTRLNESARYEGVWATAGTAHCGVSIDPKNPTDAARARPLPIT